MFADTWQTMPTNAYYRRQERRKVRPLDERLRCGTVPDVDAILYRASAQRAVWHFIDSYKEQWNGHPPTRQQIAAHMDCSKQRIDAIIEALEEKQVIVLDELLRPMIYWKEYSGFRRALQRT